MKRDWKIKFSILMIIAAIIIFGTNYLVFFKGRDVDAMTAAFQEFSAKKLNRDKKPSIRKALAAAKDKSKQLNQSRDKVKKLDKGREL